MAMAMKAATRLSVRTDTTAVFKRLGSRGNQQNIAVFKRLGNINQQVKTAVCKYWLEGRCTRNPCKFLHPKSSSVKSAYAWKNPNTFKSSENSPPIEKPERKVLNNKQSSSVLKKQRKVLTFGQSQSIEKVKTTQINVGESKSTDTKGEKSEVNVVQRQNCMEAITSEVNIGQSQSIEKTDNCMKVKTTQINVGESKSTENCTKGEKSEVNIHQSQSIEKMEAKKSEVNVGQSNSTESCTNGKKLQSWFCGNGLSMVAQLEGHTKAVTGIVYHQYGSNKLFCGSKDKTLRVWDCNSGQCGNILNFDNECGTLVKEGPWIFAGLRDMIKAWNFETQNEVIIRASGGQVNAITMYEDTLFAGMEDGTVLLWRSTSKTSFSEEATCLKGHTGSVLSLIVGAKMLFSASADQTIRVWDCESLECKHVLNGHTGDVTAVLCWDQYLLSGSSDKTIRVWGATESAQIEQVYKLDVDDAVIAFAAMHDAEQKPMLLCSCKGNGVYIYDLPSFVEKGRIYSICDIQSIQIAPEGLFFTGDASGLVTVWKPNGEPLCS